MRERLRKIKVARFKSHPTIYKVGHYTQTDVKKIIGEQPIEFGTMMFTEIEHRHLKDIDELIKYKNQLRLF